MSTSSLSKKRESWIARHQLPLFFALAYLLSWYPWIIALAQGRSTGPNPLGPFVAAMIMAALVGGRRELKDLLSRLVRARVGWRWYAFLFALPVGLCLAAAVVAMLVTGSHPSLLASDKWRELPDRFIFIFLFIGLGEEPGWRGFALPRLQKNHSPLIASLILAPLWAIWHLPLMGHEFPLPILPAFLVSLLGGTLVQTWLFNRTRGSVLIQMLFHATVNTIGAGLIFPLFSGSALLVLWWTNALLWLALGFALHYRRVSIPAIAHPVLA
jgi:hypothetical protein